MVLHSRLPDASGELPTSHARVDADTPVVHVCRLYANVVSTIKGYGDYFWVDVVEKIEEWGEQVLQFQAQCRKLPKALRDWQTYVDCRDTIDNFLEMLPLFQALAHKAINVRHWTQVMQITGTPASQPLASAMPPML